MCEDPESGGFGGASSLALGFLRCSLLVSVNFVNSSNARTHLLRLRFQFFQSICTFLSLCVCVETSLPSIKLLFIYLLLYFTDMPMYLGIFIMVILLFL